ncbi:helix-turn-helix domain-containing protein [Bosea thiooxidans]
MDKNWTRQEILHALRLKGTTAAAVAEKAGISRFTIYGGLGAPYPKAQKLIADALGKSRQDIWPEFYDENGLRTGLLNSPRAA